MKPEDVGPKYPESTPDAYPGDDYGWKYKPNKGPDEDPFKWVNFPGRPGKLVRFPGKPR